MSRATLVLAAVLIVGCSTGPRAPILDPFSSVYESVGAGLRIQAPPGWTMTARAEPRGPVLEEMILVRWFRAEPPAILRVTRMDLPDSVDLATHLAEKAGGAEAWVAQSPAERDTVGGVTGVRMTYAGRREGRAYRRDITAIRRGDRVYCFVAVTPAEDVDAQGQVGESFAAVRWTP